MLIKEVVQKIFIFYDNTIIESAYIIELGNHGNRQNCIKVNFYTYKEDGNRNISFGKIIGVSMAIKSYNRIKILNLVTIATTKII